jgi:PAS domain S-box-containing protein
VNGVEMRSSQDKRIEGERFDDALAHFLFWDNARDILLILREDGRILDANRTAVETYGYGKDELLSQRIHDLRDPATVSQVGEQMSLADREGTLFETVHRRRDGSTFPVEVSSCGATVGEERVLLSIIRDISPRRERERHLSDVLEFNQKILDASPYAIVTYDSTGQCVYTNEVAGAIIGGSREQILAQNFREIETFRKTGVTDMAEEALATGTEQRIEFHTVSSFGREVWLDCRLVPITSRGKPHLLLICADMTKRRMAESALRASTDTLQALVRAAPLAIVVFDVSGNIQMWNPAAERMFGWTAEEAIGKPHPIVPEEKQEEFRALREVALKGKMFTGVELRRQRKDGSPIDISVSTSPLRGPGGSITGIMSIITDITERRKSEETLLRLATAVEQSAEIILITDPSGAIQYVNPAFERITGYRRDEILGQNPRVLKSGNHDDAFYRNMWDTLLRGEVWTGAFINRRSDGTLYEEDAVISPVRGPSGEVINYVAVKRDVTNERQVEEQLRQAQKMEAVGRLAGGIAHDFNNLLTAISGYSDLLLMDLREGDPARREVQEIRKAGDRAASLTQQLLAFSRRQVLRPRVLDLNQVVMNMEKMLRRLIGEDIELVTFLAEDLESVKADPGQIEQVIANLAVNSRDAMPKGGKLLLKTGNLVLGEPYASQHDPVQPGSYVLLEVTDTGCGMDEATMSRLFEPFFTTKEVGKGTGLGLATVYGIVKQSGGYIWAYSEVGLGTTFKVYLPSVEMPAESAEKEVATIYPSKGEETVLVVEDEKMVRELVREILSQKGYNVLEAHRGTEALEVSERHEGAIHLLLTDVVMPGMDGPELARRLTAQRPDTRVLFMSGYTDHIILHDGVLEPESEFLQKPFTARALGAKVRSVLDRYPEKSK